MSCACVRLICSVCSVPRKPTSSLKQQEDENTHDPKNNPLHLKLRICVKYISIFDCFYEEGYHKEASDSSVSYIY